MTTTTAACPPGTRVGVPRTGAVACWDTEGRTIPCDGTGQDGELRKGTAPPDPRFDKRPDGTVLDTLTNLVWLQDADKFGEVTWKEALRIARNHADRKWRLANIRELLSLLDYSQADPILPKDHPFENVRSAIYWTSTTLAPAGKMAWMMTLGIGPTVFVIKDTKAHMWLVRGESTCVLKTGQKTAWDEKGNPEEADGTGQDGDLQAGVAWPAPRFDDNHDGTVTDDATGLVWLKHADAFGFKTWSHALACCRLLCSGEYGLTDGSKPGDWRLPNIREIESLVDYGRAAPCLPEGHPFQNVRPSSYWTSTTVASGPTEAMFIILGVGPSIFENKEHRFFVWPVRDAK